MQNNSNVENNHYRLIAYLRSYIMPISKLTVVSLLLFYIILYLFILYFILVLHNINNQSFLFVYAEVDSSQNCASLQMFQSVAVGVFKKCDLRSGQTQKFL